MVVEDAVDALQTVENPLQEAVNQWASELDVAPRSRENYRKAIARYLDFLQSQGLQGSNVTDVLAYKSFLQETYSPNTTNAYLVPVRLFYTWLSARVGGVNPAAGLKGAKTKQGFKKDSLTASQVKHILTTLEESSSATKERDLAILYLLFGCALRTIEVERANVEDLRPAGNSTVLYVHGKGHTEKDDFVVLPPEVEVKVRAYLATRGKLEDGAPLFASSSARNKGERMTTRSVSRLVKQAFKNAGYDSSRLTAHSARHTAITGWLIEGASVQEAQAAARHKNISTTMIYAHNINRLEKPAESYFSAFLASA